MWKLEFDALLRLGCTELLLAPPSAGSRRSRATVQLNLSLRPISDGGRARPEVFGSRPTRFWRRVGYAHVSLARHLRSTPPVGAATAAWGIAAQTRPSRHGDCELTRASPARWVDIMADAETTGWSDDP